MDQKDVQKPWGEGFPGHVWVAIAVGQQLYLTRCPSGGTVLNQEMGHSYCWLNKETHMRCLHFTTNLPSRGQSA